MRCKIFILFTTSSTTKDSKSMQTIRSNFFQDDHSCSFTTATEKSTCLSKTMTDSVMDLRLSELASKDSKSAKSSVAEEDLLDRSHVFSDFSACSSNISGELQRLACLPSPKNVLKGDARGEAEKEPEPEPCLGFLQRENFSIEIIESISPEDLQPTVKICIDGLQSQSVAVKRSAAASQEESCR